MISVEILSIETQLSTFFLQNDNKLTHNCQKLWRKIPSKLVDFNASDADRVTAKIMDCYCYHPNLYKKNILRFRIIIYRFHVFQTSGNPSLSIFTLLEPYDASSPPYIEFKWNLHWWEAKTPYHLKKKISLINYGTKRSHSQKRQHFISIKNQWKKE